MEEVFGKISLGLIGGGIAAIVKMFGDLKALSTKHDSLQAEVNEHKRDTKDDLRHIQGEYKSDFDNFKSEVNGRFDKIEKLLERLYTFETSKRRDD